MIRATQIIGLLREEYLQRVEGITGSTEVFVDPSRSELKSMGYTLRFFAHHPSKQVWVWNGELALHYDVWTQIDSPIQFSKIYNGQSYGNTLAGTAEKSGGRYEMIASDSLDALEDSIDGYRDSEERQAQILPYLKSIVDLNWSWTKPYIDTSRYLSFLRGKLERFEK